LLKAGSPETNVVNLATALHRDALAMQLVGTPGWTSRVFASIETWPERMDLWSRWEAIYCNFDLPRREDVAREFFERHQAEMELGAELLWPEREDLYQLMAMRLESGRTAFEREKQGAPVNPEHCEWPDDYFGDEIWFDQWPAEIQVRTIALDPSKGTDARHGDYSAFVMLAVDRLGVAYLQADLARRPTPRIVEDGVRLVERFRPDAIGVESNQFQSLLADDFREALDRAGLISVRPWTIDNHENKQTRIRRLGPLLSTRRLRFKSACPSTRLLVDQLRDFPIGDHDDGPDAAEMAIRLAEELLSGKKSGDERNGRMLLDVD
jgi:predicted phage terminase large subunit-like protein